MSENTVVEAASTEETAKEFLESDDRHALDLVKVRKDLARAKAETAIAQNNVAELQYNNVMLQLSLKYNLTDKDVVNDEGEILRNYQGAR